VGNSEGSDHAGLENESQNLETKGIDVNSGILPEKIDEQNGTIRDETVSRCPEAFRINPEGDP
jgi:hypothetical protein